MNLRLDEGSQQSSSAVDTITIAVQHLPRHRIHFVVVVPSQLRTCLDIPARKHTSVGAADVRHVAANDVTAEREW